MADPFIGEIRPFGFDYAPYNWFTCAGQTISAQQSPALYSIIGTRYGTGSSPNTFLLPNLSGRAAMGKGQGPGLTNRVIAATGGTETVTLTGASMASHSHALTVVNGAATLTSPVANTSMIAKPLNVSLFDGNPPAEPAALNGAMILSGGGVASPAGHENRQPYLVINYCIAPVGEYPINPS